MFLNIAVAEHTCTAGFETAVGASPNGGGGTTLKSRVESAGDSTDRPNSRPPAQSTYFKKKAKEGEFFHTRMDCGRAGYRCY